MKAEVYGDKFTVFETLSNTYLFLRHGQTDHNLQGIWTGQIDIPLNENGISQAMGVVLSQVPDMIASSPLQRARDTAYLVNEGNKFVSHIKIDDRLVEKSGGAIEGMPIVEIPKIYPDVWNAWEFRDLFKIAENSKYPDGESDLDVVARLHSLLSEFEHNATNSVFLLVTHGGTMRAMRILANLGLLDVYPGRKITNCSMEVYRPNIKGGIIYE